MADHHDLVAEIPTVEKMATQDRLKHAKKRRAQQLKKWANYEKQLEKENSKRKKTNQSSKKQRRSNKPRIRFPGKTILLEAAARNDIEDVRRLLTQGVNPDSTNEDGLTALHQCCIDDSEDMLKLLLEFGAKVNAKDSELWTPLHAAATCGHVHLCKHLIDKGAELLAVNADGNMPYDICEDEVTLDYIETEMAKRGVTQEEIDDTRLIPEREMLEDMKYLADKGRDLEYYNREGTTPLHIAAANGFLEVAEFLLDQHVSVDLRDKDYWLPIHAAACWLQPEMLELLVRNGADIDAKTKNGETAFDLCEDAEIKQKILDMKDEIENNKASRTRDSARRQHKHNTRSWSYSSPASFYSCNSSMNDKLASRHSDPHSAHSASIRRSSMRGEKNPLFMKEAKEEALHFGWRKGDDDIVEDDKENMATTNLDDVELIIDEKTDREKETSLIETVLNSESGETRGDHGLSESSHPKRQPSDKQPSPQAKTAPANPTKRQPSFTRKQDQRRKSLEMNRSPPAGSIPEQEVSDNNSSVRYPSGTPSLSLSDLKKHRQETRQSTTIDTQVQDLFLSSLNSETKKYGSSSPQSRDQDTSSSNHKNKNGHNNNMENFRHSEGIRRFKAPSHAPVVGQEEKHGCCVIM